MAWLVKHRMFKWAAAGLALLVLGLAYASSNGEHEKGPAIIIDKARAGDRCVEPEEFMRKNHMTLLKHQRDETMHKGIRTKKHSLQNCINCHASTKDDRVIGTNQHFCQSCHTYAAVSLDCWECHTPKAKSPAVAATNPVAEASAGEKK